MMGPRLLTVDTKDLKKLEKDLLSFRRKAFPFAVRNTLNDLAFESRRNYAEEAKSDMKLRGPWTVKSMRVTKVGGSLNVKTMVAVAGSVAGYMATQEGGAKQGAKGKHGVPIPAGAPGKRKSRGRVSSARQLRNIDVVDRPLSGHRQSRNAGAIKQAAKRGGGFVFLDLRRTKGLYRVSPGKRGMRVRKVWDLSKRSITVPQNPMLKRSYEKAMQGLFGHYRENLIEQMRRAKLFKY